MCERRSALAGWLLLASFAAGCDPRSQPTTARSPSTAASDLVRQGVAAQVAGNPEAAKRAFMQALVADPANALAQYNLGALAQGAGDTAAAEQFYQKAADHTPPYGPALYNLGTLATARRDDGAAERYFRGAIAANQRDAAAHFNLGLLLRGKGDLSAAVKEINLAVQLDPSLSAKLATPTPRATP